MKREEHTIDTLFREGLKDFQPEVPAYVWDNIKSNIKKEKRLKMLSYFRHIAAAIIILLAFGTGYFVSEYYSDENTGQVAEIITPASESQILQDNDIKKFSNVKNRTETIAEQQTTQNHNSYLTEQKTKSNTNQNNNLISEADVDKTPKHDYNKNQNQGVFASSASTNQPVDFTTREEQKQINSTYTSKGDDSGYNIYDVTEQQPSVQKELRAFASISNKQENNSNLPATLSPKDVNDEKYFDRHVLHYTQPLAKTDSKVFAFATKPDERKREFAIVESKNPHTEKNKESWSIGGQFSPLYALNSPATEKSNILAGENAQSLYVNSNEASHAADRVPLSSYTGGINVQYNENKRFSIRSGVFLSRVEQMVENMPVIEEISENTTSFQANIAKVDVKFDAASNTTLQQIRGEYYPGYDPVSDYNDKRGSEFSESNGAISDNATTLYQMDLDLVQQFQYVEIPLLFQYKLVDKKVGVHVLGGVNAGVLVSNVAKVKQENQEFWNGRTDEMNQVVYSAAFGMGVEYELFKNLSLNLEPTLRYGLTSLNRDRSVLDYPYTMGLYTGLNYHF
jgi:hypothetical protein